MMSRGKKPLTMLYNRLLILTMTLIVNLEKHSLKLYSKVYKKAKLPSKENKLTQKKVPNQKGC